MKHPRLALLALLLHATLPAQAQPTIEWDKTLGGSGWDELLSLQQTADGGYILGGYSGSNADIAGGKSENSRGSYDYWVVKLDANGNKQWDKTLGGSGGDQLFSLQQTADGGYILGGSSWSAADISGGKSENSRGERDYWVVKLDANGSIQWDKTLGGSANDELTSLQQTADGGYILGGWSESDADIAGGKSENSRGVSDYWVVKLDANGKRQWDKTLGGSGEDVLNSLQQTTDGGYILGGWSLSNADLDGGKSENSRGIYDYWVVKLDANGKREWDKTLGGSGVDALTSLQQTNDGGYILGGGSSSAADISGGKSENSRGERDYWVVKLDANGSIQWDKTMGGSGEDYLSTLQQT
ncbi:MAG: T9SS C-terminal target domain-containing protein, partial [Sphingobacteriia bacterium]